jgi:TonB family protein
MVRSLMRRVALIALSCACARTPNALIPDECLAPPDAHEAAPPTAPVGFVRLSTSRGHSQLTMDPRKALRKLEVPESCEADQDREYVSVVRICVSAEGAVSNVDVLQPSAPIVDRKAQEKMRDWRYHPYVVDGQPRGFCYRLKFVFRGRKERSGWLF